MNETYIKSINEKDLFEKLKDFSIKFKKINPSVEKTILKSLNFLKNKAKTLKIYNNSKYILFEDLEISNNDKSLIIVNQWK